MLALVVFLMLARSLSEGVTLLLIIPFLGVAGHDIPIAQIGILQSGLSEVQALLGFSPSLTLVIGAFLAIMMLRAAVGYCSAALSIRYNAGFVDHVRCRVQRAISRANWLHTVDTSQAENAHVLTSQAENVDDLTSSTLGLLSRILTVLTGAALAMLIQPQLALVVLAGCAVFAAPMVTFQIYAYERGAVILRSVQQIYDMLVSRMGGSKLAKGFSIERRLERQFARQSRSFSDAVVAAGELSIRGTLFLEIGAAILLVLFVYAGLMLFDASGMELIVLCMIFARLIPPSLGLQSKLEDLAGALPEYDTLRGIEARANAAAEASAGGSDTVPSGQTVSLRTSIEFKDVDFWYPGQSGCPALKSLSLQIPAGKATGIIGLSGAGKSTLADLSAGLIAPTSGTLRVDGVPITAANRLRWRAGLTYVPQDAPLYYDTVRENLLIGGVGASDSDIWDILEVVRAEGIVRKLPSGLDTIVGDHGLRLSGGERQRIRLASALLRKPSLLILDEATSALNPIDETGVIAGIRHLLGDATLIVVAHRESSVEWTEQIVVLSHGTIVDVGSPGAILGHRFAALDQVAGAERNHRFPLQAN